jgi:hypothetical protein
MFGQARNHPQDRNTAFNRKLAYFLQVFLIGGFIRQVL